MIGQSKGSVNGVVLSGSRPARKFWFVDSLLLLLLLISGLLVHVVSRGPRTTMLPVETPPTVLGRQGMYDVEQFSDREGEFRWTNGQAELEFPNPGAAPVVTLLLAGGPGRRTVPAALQAEMMSLALSVPPGVRRYHVLAAPTFTERVSLTVSSPTIVENRRELGLVIGDVGIAGTGGLPVAVLILLLGATIAGYMLGRQAGAGRFVTAGAVLAGQMGLGLWYSAGGWQYGLIAPLLLVITGGSVAALLLDRWLRPVAFEPQPRFVWSALDWRVLGGLLLLALVVRLPLLVAPDPVGDLELAARRMSFLHTEGFAGAYVFGGDYMPLRLYLLRGLSALTAALGGTFVAPLPKTTLVSIKLPGLLADLATLAILYRWCRQWRSVRGAALITTLYVLAPPVWINVAWWGQVDALLMLPLLGSIVLFEQREGRWSWICWALALLIKPQAIILAPLLYAATLRYHGVRALVRGAFTALAVFALGCTPLVLAGQGAGLLQAYLGSVERFPRLTNGAYNLWYLLTLGVSGSDVGQGLGPLSFRAIGLALVALATLIMCYALLRRADAITFAEAAAGIALTFFLLPTQIHERYLFLSLAFIALRAAENPRFVWVFVAVVLSATLNILGTLRGFLPAAYAAIAGSPLPLLLAGINMLLLIGVLVHLWRFSGGQRAAVRTPAYATVV